MVGTNVLYLVSTYIKVIKSFEFEVYLGIIFNIIKMKFGYILL